MKNPFSKSLIARSNAAISSLTSMVKNLDILNDEIKAEQDKKSEEYAKIKLEMQQLETQLATNRSIKEKINAILSI